MMFQQYQQSMNSMMQEQQIYCEDIKPVKFQQLEPITFEALQARLKVYLNEIQLMQFIFVLQTFYTEQIDELQFMDIIHQAFGDKLTFYLFPMIIASIEEEHLQHALDKTYMMKHAQLPKKTTCLLNKCKNYAELFLALIQEIETEMKLRIMQRKISFVPKKPLVER